MARTHSHKRVARAAAISIISLIGAVLAIWAAPRVSDAVAVWMGDPPVRSVTLRLDEPLAAVPSGSEGVQVTGRATADEGSAAATAAPEASAVLDAGMRFTMLGVMCTPPAGDQSVTVLFRTSEDGMSWSRWFEVPLEEAAEEGGAVKAFTEPVWTGGGRYVQLAARRSGSGGAGPVALRGVSAVALNSTEDADRSAVVGGIVRRVAATIAAFDLAPAAAAMTSKPAIVTRQEWGADESWRSGEPSFAPVKMAFIHHTDSGNDYTAKEAPAIVRAIYHYHTQSLHWSDIAYNFLIDRYGTIYEGRYGGVTKGAVGAQTLGFNTGSTGISVIGTFTTVTPRSASLTSLERLLEWKLDIHHIDPEGSATLVCGYGEKFRTGQKVQFPAIAGHRDANFTDCPGGQLYSRLPAVRRVVGRTGQPKIYGFVVEDPWISPDGDGVSDKASIAFTLSQKAQWKLTIKDPDGKLVREASGEGTAVATTWAGRDDDGKVLPDGAYEVEATASNDSGVARSAVDVVHLDTVPPRVAGIGLDPDPFSPNGDGQNDRATLTFKPGEQGLARVSVVDAGGAVLRRVTGWTEVAADVQRVTWDGRVQGEGKLVAASEGAATVQLEVRDLAGNTTTERRRVVVDRTLKLTSPARAVFSPNGDGRLDAAELGFRLTRDAVVTVAVTRDGKTVRTMRLGSLEAGARSVTWDGRVNGDGTAESGAYRIKVTADGAVGTTAVLQSLTVDLVAPEITAPETASVRRGKTASVTYSVRDAFSRKVRVSVTVTDAEGQTVATIDCGRVTAGASRTVSWKPPAKGTYTLSFAARDQGGNDQAAVVTTLLTVR